jgi:hypothetical protein
MPRVEFKLTDSVFEWAKTLHVLDHAATVIGKNEGIQAEKKYETEILPFLPYFDS